MEKPIFLIGAERSGTTMLRAMLMHHPRIAWVGEFDYAVLALPEEDRWPSVEQYTAWLEGQRIFRASGLEIRNTASYPELVDDFLVQCRERAGKPVVGATVHRRFDELLRIWPDARFIHLVRDPRDVSRSRVQAGWAGNVWVACDAWLETERLWSRMRVTLDDAQYHELTYEQLLAEPECELERICEFIGVAYDAQMLEYHKHTTYGPPDPSLQQQWRRKLTPREVALIEGRIGEMMQERGYELSGHPPRVPSPAGRLALHAHNRMGRVRARVRQLGVKLWLQDVISRRTGPPAWRQRVQLALEADTQRRVR